MAVHSIARDTVSDIIALYTDPDTLPNRMNQMVLRKHSRRRVQAWLSGISSRSDEEIREKFWPEALGDVHVKIPDAPGLGRNLRRLTAQAMISPEALDTYLTAHPEALSGNAEADICPKHRAFTEDAPRLRATLSVLMDTDTDVKDRLDMVLAGRYRIKGLGKATATTILECWNDGVVETAGPIFSKWSGHTERALSVLGIPFAASGIGATYDNIWRRQKQLLLDYPSLMDLSDVDLLMYFVDPRGLNMGQPGRRTA